MIHQVVSRQLWCLSVSLRNRSISSCSLPAMMPSLILPPSLYSYIQKCFFSPISSSLTSVTSTSFRPRPLLFLKLQLSMWLVQCHVPVCELTGTWHSVVPIPSSSFPDVQIPLHLDLSSNPLAARVTVSVPVDMLSGVKFRCTVAR
jgi:hypothetical protein